MLIGLLGFFIVVMALGWRVRGPIWALAITWMIAMAPIVSGLVTFSDLKDKNGKVSLIIAFYSGVFVVGAAAFHLTPRSVIPVSADQRITNWHQNFARLLPIANIFWWFAILGTALLIIDFALLGGEGLSDLAALRDTIVQAQSASLPKQLASVLTWACLYCYVFALLFWKELSVWGRIRQLVPILGYFLASVLSAGRQAALQIMVFTILIVILDTSRRRYIKQTTGLRIPPNVVARFLMPVMAVLMTSYMSYIVVARNADPVSNDKAYVLQKLYHFDVAAIIQDAAITLGPDFRAAIVEASVYFSSSIVVFETFLEVKWQGLTYGAQSFPFVFRQLSGITGLDPMEIFHNKVERLNAEGVLGSSWTTSYSFYMDDFGSVGAAVFLVLLGYYTAYAWWKARTSDDFHACLCGLVLMMVTIYMPIFPGLSDTNLFLLWTVAATGPVLVRSMPRGRGRGRKEVATA